ncbi:MAG: hypothetical protein HY537_08045 [Deltaproteobacteria bacterium]|nr:hypothetical protein [Deltaproteobacteria bacterium]
MKKLVIIVSLLFLSPNIARADLFGGDVAVLTQILAQAVMQLAKLKEILGTAEQNIGLIREDACPVDSR